MLMESDAPKNRVHIFLSYRPDSFTIPNSNKRTSAGLRNKQKALVAQLKLSSRSQQFETGLIHKIPHHHRMLRNFPSPVFHVNQGVSLLESFNFYGPVAGFSFFESSGKKKVLFKPKHHDFLTNDFECSSSRGYTGTQLDFVKTKIDRISQSQSFQYCHELEVLTDGRILIFYTLPTWI